MKLKSLFLLVLLALSGGAQADSPSLPLSYKKVTKNEKYIFVMLSIKYRNYDPEKLAEKYKESGLYLNDNSLTRLWRFGGYIDPPDISSDGQYLVAGGDWPRIVDKGETTAFTFYKNGSEIKSYKIKELVPDPEDMPKSVSHYTWCQSWKFDEDKNLLSIETIETEKSPSKKYLFDVTTGEIIPNKIEAADKK